MKVVYRLEHNRLIEFNSESHESVFEIKLLGFFSSQAKCEKMIQYYIQQSGFRDYPNDFVIKRTEANIDEFNSIIGEFHSFVFFLSYEYYDGKYDHTSNLGCYDSLDIAIKAQKKYITKRPNCYQYIEGFTIDKYEIDKGEWLEGFFTWNKNQ